MCMICYFTFVLYIFRKIIIIINKIKFTSITLIHSWINEIKDKYHHIHLILNSFHFFFGCTQDQMLHTYVTYRNEYSCVVDCNRLVCKIYQLFFLFKMQEKNNKINVDNFSAWNSGGVLHVVCIALGGWM